VLAEAQGHRCCYCGIALAPSGAAHDAETLEHMIPVAAGGRDEWLNTVVACRLCNLGRGAMLATSYYDLVRRFGREAAHEKGQAWYRRQMRRGPDGAKQACEKQHRAGPIYRVLARTYRRTEVSPSQR
jgi:hypothetical protein